MRMGKAVKRLTSPIGSPFSEKALSTKTVATLQAYYRVKGVGELVALTVLR